MRNKPLDGNVRNNKITIRLSDEELQQLKELSDELDIPLARFMRNLLLISLEDAKFMKKIGILKGAKKLEEFRKALKRKKQNTEPKLAH